MPGIITLAVCPYDKIVIYFQDLFCESTGVLENKNWFQPIVAILAQKTAILVCVTVHSRHKRTESDKKTPFWKLLKKNLPYQI